MNLRPHLREPGRARAHLVATLLLGVALTMGVFVAIDGRSAEAVGPVLAAPTPAASPGPTVTVPSASPTTTPPTAAPSATPSPPPPPPPPADDPGLFDIPSQVRKAINDTIWWITSTGLRPILEALGRTVLSTPDLAGNNRVQQLWTTSLTAANVIFVLFVVAAGIVVSARDTLQTQYGLKEILPRLAIAALAANLSLIICGKAIEATNALTKALAGQGVDGPTAAAAFSQTLYLTVNGTSLLGSLLGLAMLVMAIVVVITFIVRVGLLVVLIGVAPLALLCHALPQTEGLAQTWWRAFAACLGIQLGQAVVVVATVKVFLTPAGPTVPGSPPGPGGCRTNHSRGCAGQDRRRARRNRPRSTKPCRVGYPRASWPRLHRSGRAGRQVSPDRRAHCPDREPPAGDHRRHPHGSHPHDCPAGTGDVQRRSRQATCTAGDVLRRFTSRAAARRCGLVFRPTSNAPTRGRCAVVASENRTYGLL
jgi:hypothetical protein